MNLLFPTSSLTFEDLCSIVGPDPGPPVPGFEAHQLAGIQRRLAHAERLYHRATLDDRVHAKMEEFVSRFHVCQQSLLFNPLIEEWRAGRWGDEAAAAFVRASIKAGGDTSSLLDTVPVTELVHVLSSLPTDCLHEKADLDFAASLPDRITIHRGGWAHSASDLINRSVSWTTDFDIAEEFVSLNTASFRLGQRPFHLCTQIKKADAILFFINEEEVILNPQAITGWQELETKEVGKRQSLVSRSTTSISSCEQGI